MTRPPPPAAAAAPLLQGEEKERFNEIQQELSKLSTTFSNNVLDATKKFKRLVTSAEEVAGLPESGVRCWCWR